MKSEITTGIIIIPAEVLPPYNEARRGEKTKAVGIPSLLNPAPSPRIIIPKISIGVIKAPPNI